MKRLLILGILIISTAPLFAQAQQPNAAELAQKVVSIISGDKAKTQTYCQILDLSDELDQADQQKDREKAGQLSQKINELQKKLGPIPRAARGHSGRGSKFQRWSGDRVDLR